MCCHQRAFALQKQSCPCPPAEPSTLARSPKCCQKHSRQKHPHPQNHFPSERETVDCQNEKEAIIELGAGSDFKKRRKAKNLCKIYFKWLRDACCYSIFNWRKEKTLSGCFWRKGCEGKKRSTHMLLQQGQAEKRSGLMGRSPRGLQWIAGVGGLIPSSICKKSSILSQSCLLDLHIICCCK